MAQTINTPALQTTNTLSHATSNPTWQQNDPIDILLIEDIASDALLTRIALNATKVPHKLQVMQKGNEALCRLLKNQKSSTNTMPDLIMLDLGLPCMNGFEILDALAAAPASIRAIPIIILTAFENFEYLRKTYNLSIPAYITKPCKVEKVREVLLQIYRQPPGLK